MTELTNLDWFWIITYFLLVYAIAFWASKGQKDSRDYFLAGRGISWVIIGASMFATNIGTEHLVGLSASGYDSGLAVGHFEWQASIIVLILGWLFVPFYLNSKVVTMPEFLERRYNPQCRIYLSVISIIGYIFTKISVILFAGTLILNQLLGWDFWTSALLMIILTGIYTIIGGLKAVLYTDLLQAFVLVGGALMLTWFGLSQIGGVSGLVEGLEDTDHFSMFKPMADPEFPWTGVLLGAPILGIWYWCTDQFIVQRVLSAHGIKDAQKGTIFAGYLKILPVFLMVVPGMIGYVLVQNGAFTIENPNEIYPALVANVLPAGMVGLVAAGLLAALMSSLSSTFNSCSTLVTFDLYKRLRPQANDQELIHVGRIAVVGMMVIGILWVPFIDPETSLFLYLQAVQAYIAPPIAAVFIFGLFFRKLNGNGAFASLITGFILGGSRFILENFFTDGIAQEGILGSLVYMHFLHFAVFLFLVCIGVLFVVSYLGTAPDRAHIKGLVFEGEALTYKISPVNIVLSVILVGLIIGMMAFFF
ncbi:MAG: sodium:solute symporter [Opitutales bacterium]